jgi:hypothetical protein
MGTIHPGKKSNRPHNRIFDKEKARSRNRARGLRAARMTFSLSASRAGCVEEAQRLNHDKRILSA